MVSWKFCRAAQNTDLATVLSGEPSTLAEFTLATDGTDNFDISLVDGFNVPVKVSPKNQLCTTGTVTCATDLNQNCPAGLEVKSSNATVACLSSCRASVDDHDLMCCAGKYSTDLAGCSTNRSQLHASFNHFKTACPNAYSYAYDDYYHNKLGGPQVLFTCDAGLHTDYVVEVCPDGSG